MGSQSSKLVTENQKQEHSINYMNSGGSMGGKSGQSLKQNEALKDNKEIVNITFKWNFGGQKVFVTGTFNQWKNPVQLQRDKGGEFSILLPLPRGVHNYKFIVDGDWRFSPDDLTAPDEQGNINNWIDTTQIDSNTIDILNHAKKALQVRSGEKQQVHREIQNIQKQNLVANHREMNFAEQAPPVPPHLLKYYYVEEKQKKLDQMWHKKPTTKNVNQMDEEGKPDITSKDAFDSLIQIFSNVNALSPPPHVNVNHLSCVNFNQSEQIYNVYAITHRFKAKYTTLKFYTNKYPEHNGQQYVI